MNSEISLISNTINIAENTDVFSNSLCIINQGNNGTRASGGVVNNISFSAKEIRDIELESDSDDDDDDDDGNAVIAGGSININIIFEDGYASNDAAIAGASNGDDAIIDDFGIDMTSDLISKKLKFISILTTVIDAKQCNNAIGADLVSKYQKIRRLLNTELRNQLWEINNRLVDLYKKTKAVIAEMKEPASIINLAIKNIERDNEPQFWLISRALSLFDTCVRLADELRDIRLKMSDLHADFSSKYMHAYANYSFAYLPLC